MKAKRLTSIAAIALGATMLASCGINYKVTFSPNWCYDTTNENSSNVETLKYEVSFTAASNTDGAKSRTVEYAKDQKGSYVVTLTPQASGTETIYSYSTTETVPVTYTYHGESGDVTQTFVDTVTATVVFRSTKKGLTPISSTKTIHSHSPTQIEASKLTDCYEEYNYTVAITYDENGKNGTSVLTDHIGTIASTVDGTRTTEFEIDSDYTYVDNEQLYFALRCLPMTSTTYFSVYSEAHKAVKEAVATVAAEVNEEFTFLRNGIESKQTFSYIPVSLSLNGKNGGGEQTLWIAKKTDTAKNTNRNVILKRVNPIAYNIGELVYTLTEATFA